MLFLILTIHIYAQLPQLNIVSGQTVNLPARTYQYSRIDIQSGGTLIIDENSQAWCILYCTGNVKIQGSIVFHKFYSVRNEIIGKTPNGELLKYKFSMLNIGGNGGYGGEAITRGLGKANGGNGDDGNTEYGGGGGSGGASDGYPNPNYLAKGNDANGRNGGRRQLRTDGEGGDGADKEQYSNGGLLFIYCNGDFDGTNGEIHLEGEIGKNGNDGIEGQPAGGGGSSGGGGGGGGAPGGEGGRLFVRVKGNYVSYPNVFVQGGQGGQGGTGKNTVKGPQYIPPLLGGKNGKNGENGASGLVDFLN